jgi:hypothetical protein
LLAFVLAFAIEGDARAQNAPAAEALFAEAKELMKAERYAEACPKLAASLKLDRTVGTLMNLADCREKVGQIATAWADWQAAHELLTRSGDERAAFALERQNALGPRLPKLRLEVRAPKPGLDVYRGDDKLEPAAYDTELPVDPGTVVVTVRRGEQVLTERRVVAVEAKTTTLTLDLEAIERAAPAARPPVTGPQPQPAAPPSTTQRTVGWIVGGVGITALAVAGGLEIAALVNAGEADSPDGCVNDFCGPQGSEAVDRARTFADVGQWIGLGGLVATGIGAVLVLTAPSSPKPRAGARSRPVGSLRPWASTTATGVSWVGSL